jgi:hypothetical protein
LFDFKKWKLEVMMHGTASNNSLQFVAAAIGSGTGVAATHPFALNAQGRLQSETLAEIL